MKTLGRYGDMDILMQEQMKNRNTMMNFNTELDRIGAMNILVD